MSRILAVALIALLPLAVGCEGPEGPMGPEGPPGAQGPEGPPGPAGEDGSALVYTAQGTLNASGTAVIALPADVVAEHGPPAVSCWVSSTGETWLPVDHTPTTENWPWCGYSNPSDADPAIVFVSSSGFSGYHYFMRAMF